MGILKQELILKNYTRSDYKIDYDTAYRWLKEAIEAKIQEPNAMSVSTATIDGKPSSRIVLLRNFDESYDSALNRLRCDINKDLMKPKNLFKSINEYLFCFQN